MKKSDIKGATPYGLTDGMEVCPIEKLRKTGLGNGLKFHVGDTIEFPDLDDIQIYTTSFVTKSKEEREYELVKVCFCGRVRLIPIASFRRDRDGIEEVADEYSRKTSLCRDLQMANDDYERISILAGKTIVVRENFPGRNHQYADGARVAYNKDDINTFITRNWPVFEEKPD